MSFWPPKAVQSLEKVHICGDDQGYGTADHHLSEEADGAADHGGVEVFEGDGMRRGGMIGYRNHQVVIEWTALHLAPN